MFLGNVKTVTLKPQNTVRSGLAYLTGGSIVKRLYIGERQTGQSYPGGMLSPKTRTLSKCNRVCFINSGRQWFQCGVWGGIGVGGQSYSAATRSKVTISSRGGLVRGVVAVLLCAFWKIGLRGRWRGGCMCLICERMYTEVERAWNIPECGMAGCSMKDMQLQPPIDANVCFQ